MSLKDIGNHGSPQIAFIIYELLEMIMECFSFCLTHGFEFRVVLLRLGASQD